MQSGSPALGRPESHICVVEERFILVLPHSHPLAARKRVRLSDLADYPQLEPDDFKWSYYW